jgi:hypothetical protein
MTTDTTIPEDPDGLEDYPLVMRPKHVQDYLNRGRRQTYELFHRSDFDSFKIGGSLGIQREDFRRWLEEQKSAL